MSLKSKRSKKRTYQLKPHHFISSKQTLFLLIIFLCAALFGGGASLSERREADDSLKRYRAYRGHASAGYAGMCRLDRVTSCIVN
jgi:hypothetical protein